MAERKMEIAIKGWDEFSSALLKGLAGIEPSFKSLEESPGALEGLCGLRRCL